MAGAARFDYFLDAEDPGAKDIHGNQQAFGATHGERMSYGGSYGAFRKEASDLAGKAEAWRRGPFGAQPTDVDWSRANAARAMGQASRAEQLRGQEYASQVASGAGPAASQHRFAADLDSQALAQAGAMGARGGVGAQRAGVGANLAAVGQYGTAVAGETAAGRAAYMDGAGALRGADMGQGRLDMDRGAAEQGLYYGGRGLRDQMELFYEEQRLQAMLAQQQGSTAGRRLDLSLDTATANQRRDHQAYVDQRRAAQFGAVGSILSAVPIVGQAAGGMVRTAGST